MFRHVHLPWGAKVPPKIEPASDHRLPPPTLSADVLNILLEFLPLCDVLQLRLIATTFKHYIDNVWVCRELVLSPRFLATISDGAQDKLAQAAIDYIAPHGVQRKQTGATDYGKERAPHFMLTIYRRSVTSLRRLKWLPGENLTPLCPASYSVPRYKVVAPNIDNIILSCRETLETLDLRACYMYPSALPTPSFAPSSPPILYDFPMLQTLIHTTQGFAKGAAQVSGIDIPECPKLRYVELSIDIPRSCMSTLCESIFRRIQQPYSSMIPEDIPRPPPLVAQYYFMKDYGYTTCRALDALLTQSLGKVNALDLANVWGVGTLTMISCLSQIVSREAKRLVNTSCLPIIRVHSIVVAELPSDLIPALHLLDHLLPSLRPMLTPECTLKLHVIPPTHTPLALGRNIANQSLGGDIEESLVRILQSLLSCDDDSAQHLLNRWKANSGVDLFVGCMKQPSLKGHHHRSFRRLHNFHSISLNVSCLSETSEFLSTLPSFKGVELTVITNNRCNPR